MNENQIITFLMHWDREFTINPVFKLYPRTEQVTIYF